MTTIYTGVRSWSDADRDEEGHRTYKVKSRIQADPTDGPANILRTPGLFVVGAVWQIQSDIDIWAWCRPTASISAVDDPKTTQWDVEQTFSSKPPDRKKSRCQDLPIEDPILEPPKVSGSVINYQEEAVYDRFGNLIQTSSFEQIRGKQVEFDKNREQIKIEKNYAILGLETVAPLVDTVNQYAMWGLPPRTIKLSTASWERIYEGSCFPYYKWTYNFDIRYDTFDRDLIDEGAKCLNGDWGKGSRNNEWILININGAAPNPNNPNHYCKFRDRFGNTCRTILDGGGLPAGIVIGSGTGTFPSNGPGNIHVEYYDESDFIAQLNIPTEF